MSMPDIQNWFTPETGDKDAGRIFYDGQVYTPDEVDLFAAELNKLADFARSQTTASLGTEYSLASPETAAFVAKHATRAAVAEDADSDDAAGITAHRIIRTWTRGLITLAEMVGDLQKVADAEHRKALAAGAEIAARRKAGE
jgi:hypothetical protein